MGNPSPDSRIRSLETCYLVHRDHPAPGELAARLDAVAARSLPRALDRALADIGHDDDRVCFVRLLEARVTVNAGWDADAIARAWGRTIAERLAVMLDARAPSPDVVWFDDRAAYLRQLMLDLAAGHAWRRWYHREMRGLRALSDSAAIRSVACDPDGPGRDALLGLAPADLLAVLRALTADDAERVLAESLARGRVAASVSGKDLDGCVDGLARAWRDAGHRLARLVVPQIAVYLCQRVLAAGAPVSPGGAAAVAAAVATVVSMPLARDGGGAPAKAGGTAGLVRAIARGDARALRDAFDVDDLQRLRPLAGVDEGALARLVRALEAPGSAHPGDAPVREQTTAAAGPRFTGFGGAFFLLPVIAELPVTGCEPRDARVWRFLSMLQALAPDHFAAAFADPVLRDLMAIEAGFHRRALEDWRRAQTPRQIAGRRAAIRRWRAMRIGDAPPPAAGDEGDGGLEAALAAAGDTVLRVFAARLPGFARASDGHLRRNLLDVHAAVQVEHARWVVHVGRPPLDVVLRLAGIARQQLQPPWLDGTRVELYPEP